MASLGVADITEVEAKRCSSLVQHKDARVKRSRKEVRCKLRVTFVDLSDLHVGRSIKSTACVVGGCGGGKVCVEPHFF